MTGTEARIFVQIPSYRDPECPWTVRDLFEKAEHPRRVFVGICRQYGPEEDGFGFAARPGQVRIRDVPIAKSKGVCWARQQVQELWQGEEYALQIDSHMRFAEHWDSRMIALLERCGSTKPVLSTYPLGYTPPDRLADPAIPLIVAKEFNDKGILKLDGKNIPMPSAPGQPVPSPFCAAGFLFAPSDIIEEVPYDPHLYFHGEEITLAARLWTHGWDIFAPNEVVIYHYYGQKNGKGKHWSDHEDWTELNRKSLARVKHLLGTEAVKDPEVLADIERYGLGGARPLAAYEKFSGVDFSRKAIAKKAREGAFARCEKSASPATIAQPRRSPRKHVIKKVIDSEQVVVFDDFVPEETFHELHLWALYADYKHINTGEKVTRTWRLPDGFPLRSKLSLVYHHERATAPDESWAYPTGTAFDLFAENLNRIIPEVSHLIGRPGADWDRYSITSFLYPAGTGLSVHKDGRVSYSGAYSYFLSPRWNIHWGGLLLALDPKTRFERDEVKLYGQEPSFRNVWLDTERENDQLWEPGLAQCIFPKRNRLVFIGNEALHMITKVTESAGDNARMAYSGFFERPKS